MNAACAPPLLFFRLLSAGRQATACRTTRLPHLSHRFGATPLRARSLPGTTAHPPGFALQPYSTRLLFRPPCHTAFLLITRTTSLPIHSTALPRATRTRTPSFSTWRTAYPHTRAAIRTCNNRAACSSITDTYLLTPADAEGRYAAADDRLGCLHCISLNRPRAAVNATQLSAAACRLLAGCTACALCSGNRRNGLNVWWRCLAGHSNICS